MDGKQKEKEDIKKEMESISWKTNPEKFIKDRLEKTIISSMKQLQIYENCTGYSSIVKGLTECLTIKIDPHQNTP